MVNRIGEQSNDYQAQIQQLQNDLAAKEAEIESQKRLLSQIEESIVTLRRNLEAKQTEADVLSALRQQDRDEIHQLEKTLKNERNKTAHLSEQLKV